MSPDRRLDLPPFFSLVALESIDSTNEELHRRARAGAEEGTLLWAREQSRGRGRRGRDWSSPQGNLYFSLLLRPRVPPASAAQIGFVAAVALAETFEGLLTAGRRLGCKWPNDLLIDGAKVSGILPEAEAAGGVVEAVVLGMGVNVASFPAELPYRATSLVAAGADASIESVLEALAPRLETWYRRWREEGFAPVRRRWLDFAAGLGAPIEVRLEREVLQGRFAGLDASGALDLELADGRHRLITAGDVFHPAG
jgi:BirA family transcriptional regulator, biotin operon repressor / biotin---[acetyl-CoA-carboxylase] ligase